ncbi:MAG: carbohydrate ABC transporter permease [Mangrovicoccus sp.]
MSRRIEWVYAWALLAPAAFLLALFTHVPAVNSLIHSLYSTPRGRRPARWIGLENYERLLDDPVFWKVVTNNLWFALGTIPLSMILALLMALWVNERLLGRGLLRMFYFAPTILPLIAVANIWLFFYTPGFGLIDQILRSVFDMGQTNLLGDPDTVLYAIMAVTIWKEAGFFMIFYLAALQSLPPSLIEAAKIEGAGRFYTFRRLIWPLLMPTTLFVSINAVINSFRLVDHIFILTEGGPDNASSLLLFYIYETAFRFWDTSYGAALTMVMITIMTLIALGQFFFFDRRIHYK